MLRDEQIYLTKLKLSNSLKELVEKKPYRQIKVKEIVETCGMNRQTFYYHFDDIYDLTKWTIMEELKKNEEIYDENNWQNGLINLMNYISDNRKMCMGLYNSLERTYFRNFFYNEIYQIVVKIEKKVKRKYGLIIPTGEEDFLRHYITISIEALIESWTCEEFKQTPEEIIEHLRRLYSPMAFGLKRKNDFTY